MIEPEFSDASAAVLSSDLAVEVTAEFDGKIDTGHTAAAASKYVFMRFRNAMASAHDGPVVILALAALQMRENALQPVVRDAAVDLIDSGEAMTAYRTDDSNTRKARKQLLDLFAEQLGAAAVTSAEDEL